VQPQFDHTGALSPASLLSRCTTDEEVQKRIGKLVVATPVHASAVTAAIAAAQGLIST
jgi:hypothetical protein